MITLQYLKFNSNTWNIQIIVLLLNVLSITVTSKIKYPLLYCDIYNIGKHLIIISDVMLR